MGSMRWMVAVFAFMAVSGCRCAGREFSVKKTFNVHSEAGDALCTTERRVENLGDDSAFKDLKNNISNVELIDVSVLVNNAKTRDDSIVTRGNGHVRVATDETGAATDISTYSDLPITQDSRQSLQFDPAGANKLTELALNPPNTFYIEAEGCNDQVPAFYDFTVELTFFADLKLF